MGPTAPPAAVGRRRLVTKLYCPYRSGLSVAARRRWRCDESDNYAESSVIERRRRFRGALAASRRPAGRLWRTRAPPAQPRGLAAREARGSDCCNEKKFSRGARPRRVGLFTLISVSRQPIAALIA
ncbi:hypothetical protein EVAR_93365_1 [Eumeta japonica]|uniref:Uncharacterized protein n=1 Tax=Eumeta variegata TaxID=151549 RepID=A0A4C1UT02_EUMVA|nr:hypothetical protein EVAR_93365_1 [Eumeta japonica]